MSFLPSNPLRNRRSEIMSRMLTLAILAVAVVMAIAAPTASAQALTLPTIEYKCYVVPPGRAVNKPATLSDQFDTEDVHVQQPLFLCNPASKTFNGTTFGGSTVTVGGITIEVPHLKCYKIVPSATVNKRVTLTDQFGTEEGVLVTTPQLLCTTVTKTELSGANSLGSDRIETASAAPAASGKTTARSNAA